MLHGDCYFLTFYNEYLDAYDDIFGKEIREIRLEKPSSCNQFEKWSGNYGATVGASEAEITHILNHFNYMIF